MKNTILVEYLDLIMLPTGEEAEALLAHCSPEDNSDEALAAAVAIATADQASAGNLDHNVGFDLMVTGGQQQPQQDQHNSDGDNFAGLRRLSFDVPAHVSVAVADQHPTLSTREPNVKSVLLLPREIVPYPGTNLYPSFDSALVSTGQKCRTFAAQPFGNNNNNWGSTWASWSGGGYTFAYDNSYRHFNNNLQQDQSQQQQQQQQQNQGQNLQQQNQTDSQQQQQGQFCNFSLSGGTTTVVKTVTDTTVSGNLDSDMIKSSSRQDALLDTSNVSFHLDQDYVKSSTPIPSVQPADTQDANEELGKDGLFTVALIDPTTLDTITPKHELMAGGGGGQPPHSKKPRTIFSDAQACKMKEVFRQTPYITRDVRTDLANNLDISEDTVAVWFKNQRSKLRKLHQQTKDLASEWNC